MRVTVRLGEPFWRQVSSKEVTVELPTDATVGVLLDELARTYPALKQALQDEDLPTAVFVGDELASNETALSQDSRPTLLWAMAGG